MQRRNLYGSPPWPYLSMKKSNQKSLGEGPETPTRRSPPARKRYAFPENWGPRRDARPAGERRTHRSGEGCPKHSEGSARLKRRLRPTSARGYLESVSVRSTDDASHRSYPALQATKGGSSRGNLPLAPVLLPFAGAKGRPPPARRASPALQKAARRRQATTNPLRNAKK